MGRAGFNYLGGGFDGTGGLAAVRQEMCPTDAELLRGLASAREEVEALGIGGGRLDRLTALEIEMDVRLEARRTRSSAWAATLPEAL